MDSEYLAHRIARELGSTLTSPAAAALHPPPRVADHELIRRIGEGSYGEVWLARAVTGQWRAVKAVSRDRFTSERPFEREFHGVVQFEPISRSHAGLVHVLHVGRDEAAGVFYYVMELADPLPHPDQAAPVSPEGPAGTTATLRDMEPDTYRARTLRSDLKLRGRLPVAEVVALGVELAGALGHIHRHGLVHRDVKPSNVIFVGGRPKLADLGLVTSTGEARSFVGTEGFIPPEGPGTVKADLFALGRLLYESATGKDRCDFPELPSDLDAWPDREEFLELNEVLTRLCAPEIPARYANAAEVAGDLNLILAGRSVRRAYGIERRLRRARRIGAFTLLVLALVAGVVWLQQARQRETEARAEHERTLRERAETAEHESRRQLYTALIEQARATVRGGEYGQRVKALDAIRRAAAITNSVELRREALTALALPDLRPLRHLPFGAGCTAKEPDRNFERIAVCRGRGPVEIHSMKTLERLATLPACADFQCYVIDWSPDGKYLAVKRDRDLANASSDLELWELTSPPRRIMVVPEARFSAWTFHPQRPEILIGKGSATLVRIDLERGVEIERRAVGATPVFLEYAPDASAVAAGSLHEDGWAVSIHDEGRPEARVSHVFPAGYGGIAWHPAGRWLAVTDHSCAVHLMDPQTGEVKFLGRHRAEAVVAKFDPRGDYLFTGGWERSVICWDLRSFERAYSIEMETWRPRLSADGSTLALLTDDGVRLHAIERPEAAREVPVTPQSRVRHGAFSPDGSKLAVSTDDGLAVCDLASGRSTFDAAAGARLFWSADGTELFGTGSGSASGSAGGVHRWRVTTGGSADGTPVLETRPFPRPDGFNSFSLVSDRLVWTLEDGSFLAGMDEPASPPWPVKSTSRGINGQSPDGRWLGIYIPNSPVLQIYQLPGLTPFKSLHCPPRVAGFSFSPRGDELAVVSRGHLDVYSTATWERLRGTAGVIGIQYYGCLYQPDGRAMWLAANLRQASLRDAHTFEVLLPLPAGVFPVALSPDGRKLAASVEARRVLIFDLPVIRRQLRELDLDWDDRAP